MKNRQPSLTLFLTLIRGVLILSSFSLLLPSFTWAQEKNEKAICREKVIIYTNDLTAREACNKGWNVDVAINLVDEGFLSRTVEDFSIALHIADTVSSERIARAKQLIREGYHRKFVDAIETVNKLEPEEIKIAQDLFDEGYLTDMQDAAGTARRNDEVDIQCANDHVPPKKDQDFHKALGTCKRGHVE